MVEADAILDDKNKEKVFCGEFVADVYMTAGLLAPDVNKKEFSPACFDSTRHVLLRDAKFSQEHRLLGPNKMEDRVDQTMGWESMTDKDFFAKVDTKVPIQAQMYQPPKPVAASGPAPTDTVPVKEDA